MESANLEYVGNLVSFQPRARQFLSRMYHGSSEIPGDDPVLQGNAALVRTIRLEDANDIKAQRGELQAVGRISCHWKARKRED